MQEHNCVRCILKPNYVAAVVPQTIEVETFVSNDHFNMKTEKIADNCYLLFRQTQDPLFWLILQITESGFFIINYFSKQKREVNIAVLEEVHREIEGLVFKINASTLLHGLDDSKRAR
jgi:hypothetical protein